LPANCTIVDTSKSVAPNASCMDARIHVRAQNFFPLRFKHSVVRACKTPCCHCFHNADRAYDRAVTLADAGAFHCAALNI
jgi:hypothetical protein